MDCKIVKMKLGESDFLPKSLSDLSEDLRNHVWNCPDCREYYNGLIQTKRVLQKVSNLEPPQSVLNHYMSDLNRKIKLIDNPHLEEIQETSSRRWGLLKPAFSVITVVIIVFSVWWFGIKTDVNIDTENLATDSIDYYLDAFTEEAAQNSVASVKGFEYEWAYNINIKK